MKTERVVFVVTHEGDGTLTFYHRPYDFQGLPDFRTSVNIISYEKCFSVRMSIRISFQRITQLNQQFLELISVAVYIAYKIIHICYLDFIFYFQTKWKSQTT